MSDSKHSDMEMEVLLIGKWLYETASEKVTIEFKDDMTYEQTKIQMLLFSRLKEFVTGNKFTGVWYVRRKQLHLNLRNMPTSLLNFKVLLAFELSIADMLGTLGSVLLPERYEIMRINTAKMLMQVQDKSIIVIKLNHRNRW